MKMVTMFNLGEIPLKRLNGNKSAMVRQAMDAFLEMPAPQWSLDWRAEGRGKIGVTIDQLTHKRVKDKAKQMGIDVVQAVEIGIMGL